jgi:antitoxin MazE
MTVMKTRLVQMGKSLGIRIPQVLLDQLGLSKEVEVAVERDQLVIRSAHRPREGWAEQFHNMAERGKDNLLDAPVSTRFDEEEWEW